MKTGNAGFWGTEVPRALFKMMIGLSLALPAPAAAARAVSETPAAAALNRGFEEAARQARRGLYPRGVSGQQNYWTVVGVDGGGRNCALMSEDGAVEPAKGGFSIEPFLISGGRMLTWADVMADQSLADGYLPIPAVNWRAPGDLALRIEAFAAGKPEDARLLVRYEVENRGGTARQVTLALAVRPFQVNPPTQTLNTVGGASPITRVAADSSGVTVDGRPEVFALRPPDQVLATAFDNGDVAALLDRSAADGSPAGSSGSGPAAQVRDPSGRASAAMLFSMDLPAHGRGSVELLAPLSGSSGVPPAARQEPGTWVARQRDAVAAAWRAVLNDVSLTLPAQAKALADTLRTSLAYILISRDGPALQPGTRSYARTWIRDGAMMSEGLLRMGRSDVVRDFIQWYAPYQFDNGKVPCCVDGRGADPVPENDSHGEFIFTVAELYRFAGDKQVLRSLWPRVARAVDYMDKLRASERTAENRADDGNAAYGLMPASISHEGYAKKPMHSYWDDFWALTGYDAAVELARALEDSGAAGRIAASRDQFRDDLHASIRAAAQQHGITYMPGCSELGDFDATSTTIALSPCGEQERLPQTLLDNTFERYFSDFTARRDKQIEWQDYTPYELRTVAALTRLGKRDRVQQLLDFFMADRRPAAWNGWAEVVRRDPRSPGFVGDMPHAWIASDYIRSLLDTLAYRRPGQDAAMVLAAGIPAAWLDGPGVGLAGLRTPWGRFSYVLRREGGRLMLRIDAEGVPPGGFILPWPYAGTPGRALVNGREAGWDKEGLRIVSAQARVEIAVPDATVAASR